MLGKILVVLEIKFILPAFLSRTRSRVSLCRRVDQDGRAELLVHQDAGLLLRRASGDGEFEAVVDYQFCGCDLRGLLRAERFLPAEHLCLERSTVIEGQDVQRTVEADIHDGFSLRLR